MIKNRATLADEYGGFSDWVELENRGDESIALEGWVLSDKDEREGWVFPAVSIEPGAFLLIRADGRDSTAAELHTDFSLSEGETLSLMSPSGLLIDKVQLSPAEADCSELFSQDGAKLSIWPSPGYENTAAGYEAFCLAKAHVGPLVINEVSVFDLEGEYDWVELKNISDSPVELSDFYLSDDDEARDMWQLPQQTLAAGEFTVISCDSEDAAFDEALAPFSLDGGREQLYLSHSDGKLADYLSLHDIGLGGSMGRTEGEKGSFYFEASSPWAENGEGKRRIASMPTALTADGVFNDVSSVSLELAADGAIYYTTDGSVPTESSTPYTGPIQIEKTSVVRAVAVEEGAWASRPLTLSYIINEGHSLPVISLVADDWAAFERTYRKGSKSVYHSGNAAYYEQDGSFNMPCLLDMKGWTSLSLPKKSIGLSFKSALGGNLRYDVFHNGLDEYSSLTVRAGQDYTFSYIRNELFQDICLEMESPTLTQESQYSVLYLNGQYWGLYCLKEDFSKQYYASHAGVSKDSVEVYKAHFETNADFSENVYKYCLYNDLSDPQCYETLCSRLDIDSFIDWFILQGYSANTDIRGNTRYFRSPENGNRWTLALYDLDWAFYYPYSSFVQLTYSLGNSGVELPEITNSLLENEQFRMRLLQRFSELSKTLLSNESVLARIDQMAAEIQPEVYRDRERWWLSYDAWLSRVQELRDYLIVNEYDVFCIERVCDMLDLTDEERMQWFGR